MRLSLLAVCMAGLLSFTTSAVMASPKAAADKEKAKSSKAAEKGVEKVLAGPVVSVNVEKKEIVIERKGKQYAILLDASTKVAIGGQTVGLDMIKAGESVSISYLRFSDGSRVALNIAGTSAAPVSKKSEIKKEAAPAPKAEPKVEAKKEASAAAKADVAKAETKVEAKKEASAAAKADVAKAETKVEAKKEASAAAKADVAKAETKVEAKKEASAAAKADVAKAETKVEAKKEASAAAKTDVAKAETKADSAKAAPAAQPVKVQK